MIHPRRRTPLVKTTSRKSTNHHGRWKENHQLFFAAEGVLFMIHFSPGATSQLAFRSVRRQWNGYMDNSCCLFGYRSGYRWILRCWKTHCSMGSVDVDMIYRSSRYIQIVHINCLYCWPENHLSCSRWSSKSGPRVRTAAPLVHHQNHPRMDQHLSIAHHSQPAATMKHAIWPALWTIIMNHSFAVDHRWFMLICIFFAIDDTSPS